MPGFEDAIQGVVEESPGPRCGEVRRDRMGNVIGLGKATGPPRGARPLRAAIAARALLARTCPVGACGRFYDCAALLAYYIGYTGIATACMGRIARIPASAGRIF